MSETPVTTSTAARIARASESTIRLWERSGLLRSQRTESGIRLYRREDVEAVAAARQAARGQ